MPEAIAAMVDAWLEAQEVGGNDQAAQSPEDIVAFGSDPWWERICTYCPRLPSGFTTNQALVAFELVKSEKAITKADQCRIAPMLKALGYTKDKGITRLGSGRRGYLWR
jgi:hypothetical protein